MKAFKKNDFLCSVSQDPLTVQRNMLVGVKQLKVFIGQLGISKVQ